MHKDFGPAVAVSEVSRIRFSRGYSKVLIDKNIPADADERRTTGLGTCYPVVSIRRRVLYERECANDQGFQVCIPPRRARTFGARAGYRFRILSAEGSQVGDLNLWNAHDLTEPFLSGKTRQLHATHVTTSDRLWSNFPGLRPMAINT